MSRMKLGNSCGFEKFGDRSYEMMKKFGYDCHDFNMPDTNSELYTLPLSEAVKILNERKKKADDAGIEIWQVHGPWRYPPRDFEEKDRAERMEAMKRCIYMASVLGCRRFVIHPIMPFGTEDLQSGMGDETFSMNVEFFSSLLNTAKDYDVTICYENMPFLDFSISKPEDIIRVIDTVNDSHFKMCFDTGHVGAFEIPVGDDVRRCGERIEAFHIHDTKCNLDLHLLPGYGVIDWRDFSKALKDIKFKGCFSFETSPPANLPTEIYIEQNTGLVNIADAIIKGEF